MRRLIVVPVIAVILVSIPMAIWLAPRVEPGGIFSELRWGLPVALGLAVGPAAFVGLLFTRWLYPLGGLPTVRRLIGSIPAILVALVVWRLATHTDLIAMMVGTAAPSVHDDRVDLAVALALGFFCGILPVVGAWRFIAHDITSRYAHAARDALAATAIYGLAWFGTGIVGARQAAIDARARMDASLSKTAPMLRQAPSVSGQTLPPYWWCVSSALAPGLLVRDAGFVAAPLDAEGRQEFVVWLIYRTATAGTIAISVA